MPKRRSLVGGIVLVLLAASSPALADLKIGVAAEPYPPFSSKDASGKWVGWEIDFIAALCAEMQEKCEIVDVAWDGIIPALSAKKIDVIISSMSITDKRKQVISFSAPYYVSSPAVSGPKDGDKDVSAGHMAGKTIGVQVSTTHAAYVEKYFGKTSEIKTYQTQDEANQDLAAGRIDYVVQDGIATMGFLKSDQGGCCEIKGTLPNDAGILGIGAGAGIRKEDVALAAKLDAAIASLGKAGKFDEISKAHDILGLVETPK